MKFSVATLLALPLLAVATPVELTARTGSQPAGSCNTGSLQCCNSTMSSTSATAGILAGLLGIVLGPIGTLVGLGCSPINVVGVGSGNACTASPVCCTNNNVGGLLSIGCLPITL